MKIDGLIEARLIKRYKRFLADVEMSDGKIVTVHCPNPGSMKGCLEESSKVFLKDSKNPKRKLQYSWILVETKSSLVIVDTGFANKFVGALVEKQMIDDLTGYGKVLSEPKYLDGRFDLLLTNAEEDSTAGKRSASRGDCFVEIKSTTLKDGDAAQFPDARTERGRKHLEKLARAKSEGIRAVQFFLVNRTDTKFFEPAGEIDPQYAETLKEFGQKEVEVLAYDIDIDLNEGGEKGSGLFDAKVELGKQLPVKI